MQSTVPDKQLRGRLNIFQMQATLFFVVVVMCALFLTAQSMAGDMSNDPFQVQLRDCGEASGMCESCARETKSRQAFPLCCARLHGVYEWCANFLDVTGKRRR